MMDYEIWGPNEDGEEVKLDTRNGAVPNVGDTITVHRTERKVKAVNRHHEDDGTIRTRVRVGQQDHGEPMPNVF